MSLNFATCTLTHWKRERGGWSVREIRGCRIEKANAIAENGTVHPLHTPKLLAFIFSDEPISPEDFMAVGEHLEPEPVYGAYEVLEVSRFELFSFSHLEVVMR